MPSNPCKSVSKNAWLLLTQIYTGLNGFRLGHLLKYPESAQPYAHPRAAG